MGSMLEMVSMLDSQKLVGSGPVQPMRIRLW